MEWIDIKTGLPEVDVYVLIAHDGNLFNVTIAHWNDFEWICRGQLPKNPKATHWMPLPNKP